MSELSTADIHSPALSLRGIVAPGLEAVRRFWKPFALLQCGALTVVVGYYVNPQARVLCERLSAVKQHAGLIFTAIAAAVAGALLPELAKAVMLADRRIDHRRIRDMGFAVAAFALNGIITDLQYRGMGWAVGTDAHFGTAVKKVLADQFVTTPLYGVPYWVLVYELRARRYSPTAMLRQVSPRWYLSRVLPLLIPAWAFWIPMAMLIYSLPGPLQFFLYCFALAAWSLLMVFVATRPDKNGESTWTTATSEKVT